MKFNARSEQRRLDENLRHLCAFECQNPGQGVKDIESIKREIERFHEERYHGAVVRARAERYLLGEQPTKRALADEKKYALKKEILEIEH